MRKWLYAAFLILISFTVNAADSGQFKAAYFAVKNPKYAEWQAEMQKDKATESIAESLNSVLVLPSDITLTFGECGTANAFYDPKNQRIVMCYEFMDDFESLFKSEGLEGEDLDNAVLDATTFFFYHELGHALIHVFELPATGKEEDAVDQLSTFVLADGTDEGEQTALDGAEALYLYAEKAEKEKQQAAFWDEHSLDKQRFYNIICWIYGENPEKYQDLVEDGTLPESRAEQCGDEFKKLDSSWSRLLADHIKSNE